VKGRTLTNSGTRKTRPTNENKQILQISPNGFEPSTSALGKSKLVAKTNVFIGVFCLYVIPKQQKHNKYFQVFFGLVSNWYQG
jgi:hypothetical protein